MIIGDRYQLPHVSSLSSDRERSIARRHDVGRDTLEELSQRSRSLFDVASARVDETPLLLDQHYRCHPEIIGFSNHRFYGGRLRVRTPNRAGGGVYWDQVAGHFARGPRGRSVRNVVEATRVIDRLVTEVAGNIPGSSFGVVTAFRAQAELLRELAIDRLGARMELITIDTVHRFQGDERDVIVLSPTVSAGMPPFFVRVAGHPNLLNVAVTRARWRLVVVGDRDACLLAGGALAELADYAIACERARRAPLA
jgi:superfamily I DNA and/or RNA helicase